MAVEGRTVLNKGLGAAALLPASLVGAVLVAAPFAGTTTRPLADQRPASATWSAPAPSDPASTALTTSSGTATDGASSTSVQQVESSKLDLKVPQAGLRALVLAYLTITIAGAAVIVLVASRTGSRGS